MSATPTYVSREDMVRMADNIDAVWTEWADEDVMEAASEARDALRRLAAKIGKYLHSDDGVQGTMPEVTVEEANAEVEAMVEARRQREAEEDGERVTTYSPASNTRCPSCGEYECVWVNHGHVVDAEDGDDDESDAHTYCKNCDYGLCPEC